MRKCFGVLAVVALAAGCATNPVTGERQFNVRVAGSNATRTVRFNGQPLRVTL